jgi:hypothetical protein
MTPHDEAYAEKMFRPSGIFSVRLGRYRTVWHQQPDDHAFSGFTSAVDSIRRQLRPVEYEL